MGGKVKSPRMEIKIMLRTGLNGATHYWIDGVNARGFTLRLDEPPTADVLFRVEIDCRGRVYSFN